MEGMISNELKHEVRYSSNLSVLVINCELIFSLSHVK